ncbi:MAG: hypothetical protein ACRDVC_02500 [Acidimicrobiales bacterium]
MNTDVVIVTARSRGSRKTKRASAQSVFGLGEVSRSLETPVGTQQPRSEPGEAKCRGVHVQGSALTDRGHE